MSDAFNGALVDVSPGVVVALLVIACLAYVVAALWFDPALRRDSRPLVRKCPQCDAPLLSHEATLCFPCELRERDRRFTTRESSGLLLAGVLLVSFPALAHADALAFDAPALQIVNVFETQGLALGDLTVSTPTPDRLTWTPDGLGVTGPSELTFASRTPGLPYEWDEVEGPQSLTLTWTSPVYVDELLLSNFFAGEQRPVPVADPQHVSSAFMVDGLITYDEQATLWRDGVTLPLVAQWGDGEQGYWGLGWVSVLTLTTPGYIGFADHDLTLRSVSWHDGEPHPIAEPGTAVLVGIGLLVGQLALRRRLKGGQA